MVHTCTNMKYVPKSVPPITFFRDIKDGCERITNNKSCELICMGEQQCYIAITFIIDKPINGIDWKPIKINVQCS